MPQLYKKTSIRFPQTFVICLGSRKRENLLTGTVGVSSDVFFLVRMIKLFKFPNTEPAWAFGLGVDLALDLGVPVTLALALAGVLDFYEEGQRGDVS